MIYKSLNIFYKSYAIFYKRIRIFYNRFYKKQKRFYKTSNIVYIVWNFATQSIMHIKMPLQFNFSLRFQRKVHSTENRVIGFDLLRISGVDKLLFSDRLPIRGAHGCAVTLVPLF